MSKQVLDRVGILTWAKEMLQGGGEEGAVSTSRKNNNYSMLWIEKSNKNCLHTFQNVVGARPRLWCRERAGGGGGGDQVGT